MRLLVSKQSTHVVLSVSTEASVAYCTAAWYAVVAALLFAPSALVFMLYHFLLASGLRSPIFKSIDSQTVAAGMTLLFAYTATLSFLYGRSCFHSEYYII